MEVIYRLARHLIGRPVFEKAKGLRFRVSSTGVLSIEANSILQTKEWKSQLDALRDMRKRRYF